MDLEICVCVFLCGDDDDWGNAYLTGLNTMIVLQKRLITIVICSPCKDHSKYPDSKVHEAYMGPTWVLSAPCWPHEPCYSYLFPIVRLCDKCVHCGNIHVQLLLWWYTRYVWWLVREYYNMVCSALCLQRALYTVHCTNIMHSRKPSFVITPAVFSEHCKSLFCNIRGNEIRHILLKKNHLITLDINTI